jgi:hypothetical protein
MLLQSRPGMDTKPFPGGESQRPFRKAFIEFIPPTVVFSEYGSVIESRRQLNSRVRSGPAIACWCWLERIPQQSVHLRGRALIRSKPANLWEGCSRSDRQTLRDRA